MAMLRTSSSLHLLPVFSTGAAARCFTTSGVWRASRAGYPDAEIVEARSWLSRLTPENLPRRAGELSFSRSGGPGGQNVNKVNSKATLKVPLGALFPHIPAALHDEVKKSRFYAERSGALIIQSGDSRRQSDNVEACYRKWYESMVSVGKAAIPGETSAEQKKKVKELKNSDNEKRLRKKKLHGDKKSSRGRPKFDD